MDEMFAAYFSHSWHPRDVDLNVEVWGRMSGVCRLLVDLPEASVSDPPYYVNRIEELLRRSDVFVCVLAARDAAPEPAAPAGSDGALRCSAYSLFEIRLAERFARPRLVLYERSTRFRPPEARPGEVYIPFDRAADKALPEDDQLQQVIRPKIADWLTWVSGHRRPQSYEPQISALIVLPEGLPGASDARAVVEAATGAAGYTPQVVEASRSGNAAAFRLLAAAGLMIAEVGAAADPATVQLVSAAHARGVPTIRTLRRDGPGPVTSAELPWILRDHPGGYQKDIVVWSDPAQLVAPVEARARSMLKVVRSMNAVEASRHFQSKRYAGYSAFVSHSLKPPNRQLVDDIFRQLDARAVKCFEYQAVNESGVNWREVLREQLDAATHFVALLGPGYEMSEACTYELETVLARGAEVTILAYLLDGRTTPHVKLSHTHHPLLHADPGENARVVVARVMKLLNDAVMK
jgi:hypothetical protein